MKLLNSENLIEVHEKLDEFADHHQGVGRKVAFKLVKNQIDQWGQDTCAATEGERLRSEGYKEALGDILSLLQDLAY